MAIYGTTGSDVFNVGLGQYEVHGDDQNFSPDNGNDLLIVDYSSSAIGMMSGIGPVDFYTNVDSFTGYYYTNVASSASVDFGFVYFYDIERFQIIGTSVDDIIGTGGNNDTINAGAGNDTIYGGGGFDNIDGGIGIDVLGDADFSAATTNLSFNETGSTSISLANIGTISNIERFSNLATGSGNDVISFTEVFNSSISTGSGNDTINAGLGGDVVDGGTGNDLLIVNYAGALTGSIADGYFASGTNRVDFVGIERFQIAGSSGNDVFTGGTGNDNLIGNAGNDTLNGGNGNDTLNGGTGNDNLNGGAGVDNLIGGVGDDILLGGAGKDNLNGGTGADKFKFTAVTDSGLTTTTRDTIADFKTAELDKIDLSAIDANTKTLGNQAFSFIGADAFSTTNAAGQLRFDAATHILYGSNDADATAEFSILLTGVTSLVAADFVL